MAVRTQATDPADTVIGPRFDSAFEPAVAELKKQYAAGALTLEQFEQAVQDRIVVSEKMLDQTVLDPASPSGVRRDGGIPTG